MLILLADDEKMVRLGLEHMLQELFPDEHSFMHARNGKEVVSLLADSSPDIAFLDVKMPLMNGLEALSKCRKLSPSTEWVILSGYADFEYARQAISLSAFEYVLKPIDLQTLEALMLRIMEKKKKASVYDNAFFAHAVIRSFNMADQFGPEETEFFPEEEGCYTIYQFYIDTRMQEEQHKIKQSLCSGLNDFCHKNQSIRNYCLFFNTEGNLCLICSAQQCFRITRFIKQQAQSLSHSFSVFYDSADTVSGIYAISAAISALANIRILKDCTSPVPISKIESDPARKDFLFFADSLIELLNVSIDGMLPAFRSRLQSFAANRTFETLFRCADIHSLKRYLKDFFCCEISFSSYEEFITALEQYASAPLNAALMFGNTDISKIRDFIYQNYKKDVSISYVSELFNLSPTYLSKLFHEKTGQKYIDFVTQVRMEQAKQLLRSNPAISVKQAAEESGYASVRHFSKVFKKYTGVLPSDFGKG